VLIAETISLGILSLPSVFATVGMVAGIMLILGLGIIATYTGYVFWQFKMQYPWVHSIFGAQTCINTDIYVGPQHGRCW
jgi:amino acid permease